MRPTLITVNFNRADMTVRLLDSLRLQTDPNFDVVVVDNGSSENDSRRLEHGIKDHFSSAHLMRNAVNLGFSGGNNTGIKYALQNGSEWVILVNNDTWADNDFISRLRAKLSEIEGILAIPVAEKGGLAYCGRVDWLRPELSHVYTRPSPDMVREAGRFYGIGAGLAVHRNVFEKTGLLDERYFLYFEDADFGVSARRAGVPFTIGEDIRLHHETSSTTAALGTSVLHRYHWRNAHLFNLKQGPLPVKFILPLWSFWSIIKQLLKIIFMPGRRAVSRAILAGIFDFYAGKFGKINTESNRN